MNGFAKAPRALVVLLVVALGLLVILLFTGNRLARLTGVTALAAAEDGGVWLTVGEQLVKLDGRGYRVGAWPASRWGLGALDGLASDAAGGVWLLSQGQLHHIDAAGQRVRKVDPAATAAGPLFDKAALAFEPSLRRLYVSDTGNHRILVFDAHGTLLGSSRVPLRFPNGIASYGEGQLLLAVTNQHRITLLTPALGVETWSPRQQALLHPVERWPLFLSASPEGEVYASWHDHNLGPGSVLRYGSDAVVRMVLPAGAQPQALLARASDVLIAARLPEGWRLLRNARDGEALGEFGDADLRWMLRQRSLEAGQLQLLRGFTQLALLLSALSLLVLALRLRREQEGASAEALGLPRQLPSLPSGVRAQQLLMTLALFAGYVFVLPLVFWLLAPWLRGAPPPLRLLTVLGIALFMLLPLLFWRRSSAFRQLRTHQFELWMRDWVPRLETLLLPREQVLAHAPGLGLWRSGLLVATTHRLLLLPATTLWGAAPRWQCEWPLLGALQEQPTRWRWLLGAEAVWLECGAGAGHPALRLLGTDAALRSQVRELIAEGRRHHLSQTQRLHVDGFGASRPAPSGWCALLNLGLPGLAQLRQRRTQAALLFLFVSVLLLLNAIPSWLVVLMRVADVAPPVPLGYALAYALLIFAAVADALWYQRRQANG